jgi:hypothetical protein
MPSPVSNGSLLQVAVEVALGQPVSLDTLLPCDGIDYRWDFNPALIARGIVSIALWPWHTARGWNVSAMSSTSSAPTLTKLLEGCARPELTAS